MQKPVDVIIPTYNNIDQLQACVMSMIDTQEVYPINIIVVNNGDSPIKQYLPQDITVIDSGDNLGWCGGLEKGLKVTDSPYVIFANDDIFIPWASRNWVHDMVVTMESNKKIGAVGPTSNVVSGKQNMWDRQIPRDSIDSSFLIGFCMMVSRKALEKAGGIQQPQFGGDDFDLSIRLRGAGYRLVIRRDIFVYHHGFQTGERVFGDPQTPGGWNSREMIENTNMELIRKHGFREWCSTTKNEIARAQV